MKEPYFWESYLTELPLYKCLKENFKDIQSEVLKFIELPNALHDYPKYKIQHIRTIDLYENLWKAVPLTKYEAEFLDTESDTPEAEYTRSIIKYAKENCPSIASCVKELEDLGVARNAFISKLIPGSKINPHRGRSDKYMRMHLCIADDPNCKLTVGNETKAWVEGQILAFKDGGKYLHSVIHEGSRQRVIFSVDICLDYLKDYLIIK